MQKNLHAPVMDEDRCLQCGSDELDIVVNHDVECRDCGLVTPIDEFVKACTLKRSGLQIEFTEDELPEESEV